MSETARPHLVHVPARGAFDPDLTRSALDHEHRLVTEAILLVSSGGSRRVTVAGLRYGEQIAEASRPLAATRGVRLVPLWTDDEHGADVAIEALDEILH